MIVDLAPIRDERGYFARTWCRDEFEAAGIHGAEWVQANLGVSDLKYTLRGMHYQQPPHAEFKLVRCTQGSVFDVAVDLRATSTTYRQSVVVELDASGQRSLLIPPGCAHGYMALEDNTHLEYLTSAPYVGSAVRGVRYDDPALDIDWPASPSSISRQDLLWPVWSDEFAIDGLG